MDNCAFAIKQSFDINSDITKFNIFLFYLLELLLIKLVDEKSVEKIEINF